MKLAVAILLLNMMFYLVQPVFAHAGKETCNKCCPVSNKEKNECPKNCNPFFTCMYCQYVPATTVVVKDNIAAIPYKHTTSYNSTVLQGYITSCWHPPDIL